MDSGVTRVTDRIRPAAKPVADLAGLRSSPSIIRVYRTSAPAVLTHSGANMPACLYDASTASNRFTSPRSGFGSVTTNRRSCDTIRSGGVWCTISLVRNVGAPPAFDQGFWFGRLPPVAGVKSVPLLWFPCVHLTPQNRSAARSSRMPRLIRCSAIAAALCVMSGACSGENPAGTALAPSAPRLDGGVTFGSGGRTSTETENNTTTAADSGSTATNRGGVTFGSGG